MILLGTFRIYIFTNSEFIISLLLEMYNQTKWKMYETIKKQLAEDLLDILIDSSDMNKFKHYLG